MSNQQGITPEFALGYCAMTLDGILREAELQESDRGRARCGFELPTRPKARTAKELACISPTRTFSFWMELPT